MLVVGHDVVLTKKKTAVQQQPSETINEWVSCREWSDEYDTGSESEREEGEEAMLHSTQPDHTAVPDGDDPARYTLHCNAIAVNSMLWVLLGGAYSLMWSQPHQPRLTL